MKALIAAELGEPSSVLKLQDTDTPTAGAGEVLLRVTAAAANFPDVLMCRGLYQVRPDLPFTPGIEVAGEVVEVGEGVEHVRVGERVLGGTQLPNGGFAEYALAPAAQVFPAPDVFDDAEASAFYIGYQTGWFALHERTTLSEHDTLLVHAAAGGVGSAAVQLGKAIGARVIAVVGQESKIGFARTLGADVVVDRSVEDFVAVVHSETQGRGADVIFDPVGGETYLRSTKCVAFEGRILVIGFAGGEIQRAPLNHPLIKNYSVVGLHWGLYNTKDPARVMACQVELNRLADAGAIRPFISERVPLSEGSAAIQRLADGLTVGRVVLLP